MMSKEIEKVHDSLLEIKNMLHTSTEHTGNREDILHLCLEELRIIYGRLDDSMHTTRLRTLTFLGAGLALLSYLYSKGDLFIPPERYGRVFYFLGLGLMIASICFLLQALRPNSWSVPLETKLTKLNRYKTKEEVLEDFVEQYTESMLANLPRYEKKCQLYVSGFFLLLCGGILLTVIKHLT